MEIKRYLDNVRNYTKEVVNAVYNLVSVLNLRQKSILCSIIALITVVTLLSINIHSGYKTIAINDNSDEMFSFMNSPLAAITSQRSVISIPNTVVKANPFVPYKDFVNYSKVQDVPTSNLVEPPEIIDENSDAARVMDTTVSGILYDKFSPSAILNIEGTDYLVKKGDVINNYKVVNILRDSVTVKLGPNTYKAGIGEILTDGTVNYNNVSNLSKKFGGVK